MKRLGNIWNDVLDEENAILAVRNGTKFKKKQRNVRKLLNDDHTINIAATRKYVAPIIKRLEDKTWRHQNPVHRRRLCNSSHGGKWRDLYIPTLRDHIVQHMVMQASEKAFTRGMHPGCCGSVPGRGIKHIIRNVTRWIKQDKQCRYFRQARHPTLL